MITVELLLHVNLRFPEANELHGLPLKVSPATLEDQDGVQYAYFLFGAMVSACLGACVHSATGRSTTTTYEYYHHDHDGCDDDNNKTLVHDSSHPLAALLACLAASAAGNRQADSKLLSQSVRSSAWGIGD